MSRRLMSVTAHTSVDYADAVARGRGFEAESVAVADATADRTDPDCVRLQVELDDPGALPDHMEELRLTPDQARALAADLEENADRVEGAD